MSCVCTQGGGELGAKTVGIKSTPGDHEIIREPPQNAEATIIGEITKVPKVNVEPPQIDLTSAWKVFIDGAKNRIGARAGVVLKSLE